MTEREELLRRISELEAANRELERTHKVLAARTALAWIGMAATTWRHSIEGDAINIRNCVTLLRRYLITQGAEDKRNELLDRIDKLANKILERPITPPLSVEEGVQGISINDLLRELASRMLELSPKLGITIQWKLQDDPPPAVVASSEWLSRAITILVENSIQAMSESSVKLLKIGTRTINDVVEIRISDTGHGIPQEILSKILHEPIRKGRGEKGLGIGLLLASTIIQTYGGDIRLDNTGPNGSTFVVVLPNATHAL